MPLRALDHGLRAGVAVFFEQPLFQRPGVDPDADRDVPRLAGVRHGLDVFLRADVAGVDADLVDAALGAEQRELVVKVNVRHERHVHPLLDLVDGKRGAGIGHGKAHDLAARGTQRLDLRDGRFHVPGLRVAHRLHRNRGSPAYRQISHFDLSGQLSCIHGIYAPVMILNRQYSTRSLASTRVYAILPGNVTIQSRSGTQLEGMPPSELPQSHARRNRYALSPYARQHGQ